MINGVDFVAVGGFFFNIAFFSFLSRTSFNIQRSLCSTYYYNFSLRDCSV